MEFLSSPIHTYSDETFDDAFLQLPREMDFEVNNDSWGGLSYSMHEEEDLNDGMYGVWNVKHPWSINNNASSLYNSNLHLDFIGGDPESATMVNPNFVLPNGFRVKVKYDDNSSLSEGQTSTSQSTQVSEKTETENTTTDLSDDGEEEVTSQVKKIKHIFLSAKETTVNGADSSTTVAKSPSSKNSIRVLKPSVVETNDLSMSNKLTSPQIKNDSPHLKTLSTNKSYRSSKYDFYYQNEHFYPKPAFSYSCLIAMALKNSKHGCLPVAEIYNFMCNHFPYFKTAPNGWKNSVRHNLSLNKCFEKIDKPAGSTHRKGCLWALNPSKAARLEEEVHKCARKDALSIRKAMEYPEHLELLERGELKSLYDTEEGVCEDEEDIDTNEDDTEGEDLEPNDEVCDDSEEHHEKAPAMNISEPQELPEFRIEVDDSIYDELMGTIKTEERRFAVTDSSSNVTKENAANATKKVKKVYIEMNNGAGEKATSMAKNSEAFDHYDINNFLRLENEMKTTGKRSARFTKPLVPNSAMKQIKFKTWD